MSFDRKTLKDNSKNFLKDHYWETLLLIFIIGFFSGGRGLVRRFGRGELIIWGSALFSVVDIFVVSVLNVGLSKYFIECEKGNTDKRNLFYFFNKDKYLDVVGLMFIYKIKVILWTLLFIIPGIVKGYEYFFIPYLIADNEGITQEELFRKTKEMTFNRKWDLFILDLSFIGWYFLGALLLGVGVFFVTPYHENTHFQAYNHLKHLDGVNKSETQM